MTHPQLVVIVLAVFSLATTPKVACAQQLSDQSIRLAQLRSQAIERATEQVSGAVVQVRVIGEYKSLGDTAAGALTGVLVSRRWVVTSSFGLDSRPEVLIVTLPDGATRSAALTSIDHGRKTALLRLAELAPPGAPTLEPRSDALPGETAIGLGAAYSAAKLNTSVGIVSATGRFLGRAVQTDAAVSPANYGGPLIDLRGRVLGVLTPLGQESAQLGTRLYDSGIGFAVPLDDILTRLPRMRDGQDLHPGRAGIRFIKGNPYATEARVATLSPEGPAAKAGIKKGDLVIAVGNKKVERQKQFQLAIGPYDAGDEVTLHLRRAEKTLSMPVKLAASSELKQPEKALPLLLERLKLDLPQIK